MDVVAFGGMVLFLVVELFLVVVVVAVVVVVGCRCCCCYCYCVGVVGGCDGACSSAADAVSPPPCFL